MIRSGLTCPFAWIMLWISLGLRWPPTLHLWTWTQDATVCVACRGYDCSLDERCSECETWSEEVMLK